MSDEEKDTYDLEESDESSTPAPENTADAEERGGGTCPNCGATWDSMDTVVCMECGLNLRTNEKVEMAAGDEKPVDIADEKEPEPTELCPKGRIPVPWLAGLAVATLIIAALMSGAPYEDESGWLGRITSTFIFGVASTLVGTVAIFFTARLAELKVGNLGAGVARIGIAVALAALSRALPWTFFASTFVYIVLATAVYFGAMRVLFHKSPEVPRKILPVMHYLMILLVALIVGR